MICENCGKEHDGSYKSGRFCSSHCQYAFSTKEKRKELMKSKIEKFLSFLNDHTASISPVQSKGPDL